MKCKIVSIVCAAAFGTLGAIPVPTVAEPLTSTHGSFNVLHVFEGPPKDGSFPAGGLLSYGGAIYGTTLYGGLNGSGLGTIFKINSAGSEDVLYSFLGSPDGSTPVAQLIAFDNVLYGTTPFGGSKHLDPDGDGTVFQITPSGNERVLYGFPARTIGSNPNPELVEMNGDLYGTARGEGAYRQGTVFKIDRSGKVGLLHSFGKQPDGASPNAGLIVFDGALYGTTTLGGSMGEGTVFEITPPGHERVLHSFGGHNDGYLPSTRVVAVNGMLYGASGYGGAEKNGLIYEVRPTDGSERAVYSFKGLAGDGSFPNSTPVALNGMLFGTTFYGGTSNSHAGTVYELKLSGAERVVHSFDVSDGGRPNELLVDDGTLYGTTWHGGSHECDCGVIFKLSP